MGLLRSVRWVATHRAYSRHHLLSYARMARARIRSPGLTFQGPAFIGPDVRFEVRAGYGRLIVGPYVHFGEGTRIRAHEGTVRIGAKSVFGIRTTVNGWLDISVGEACLLGDDVYVCDFDHRTERTDQRIKDQGIVKSPVRIGDDVWLGTKVTVLRGTELGNGAVVAASSVVRGRYPERSVVAGVPGRVLRTRGEPGRVPGRPREPGAVPGTGGEPAGVPGTGGEPGRVLGTGGEPAGVPGTGGEPGERPRRGQPGHGRPGDPDG